MGDRESYRVKLGRGSKFTIKIGKKADGSASTDVDIVQGQSQQASGLLDVSQQRNPYIVPPVASSVVLNFYDLAQIDDGVGGWDMIDYHRVPDLNIDGITGRLNSIVPFPKAEWADVKAKIFEVAIADWTTKYRKLTFEDAFMYGLDVTNISATDPTIIQGTNYFPVASNAERDVMYAGLLSGPPSPAVALSKWTADGLKTKSFKNFWTICTGAFNRVNPEYWFFISGYTDAFSVKVTETDNYSATEVTSFSLSGPVDVFFMPLLALPRIIQSGSTAGLTEFVYGVYEPIARDLYVHNASLTTELGTPAMAVPIGAYPKTVTFTRLDELVDYYLAQPNSFYYTENSITSVNAFPAIGTFALDSGASIDVEQRANNADYVENGAGVLLAVIKTATKTYYVWNKYDTPNGLDSNGNSTGSNGYIRLRNY